MMSSRCPDRCRSADGRGGLRSNYCYSLPVVADSHLGGVPDKGAGV